jgi:phosphopantothenoylcysteine decarboxylase/phosphopantothenate--cysteine ligase
MLKNKKILLGITGGIAAYKCAQLVRSLVKEGAFVRVIMTPSATQFVTAQTLSVLSKNEVWTGFFNADNIWHNHVEAGEWADLMVIAPLTANTLAKMASGQCDNIVLACYFSARSKTVVAPAMDLDMYKHPTVKKNLAIITGYGNLVIAAEHGELASGLNGEGRMAEPENIIFFLQDHFSENLPLKGVNALVNAGPTHEPIDPVRFVGNRSSGKMGIALAESLSRKGARVTLILGPTHLKPLEKSITVVHVETSAEMFDATIAAFDHVQIAVCSAAVADYRPKDVSVEKIKKKEQHLDLRLEKTKDILEELGRRKKTQILIGFALETTDLENYAREKLKKKNLDMIVANPANEQGSGFMSDTNKAMLIDRHNKITNFELQSKASLAEAIVEQIISYKNHNHP